MLLVLTRGEAASLEVEMQQMLANGVISLVKAELEEGFVSSMFLVSKKDGGHRPIINLKRLKEFISHNNFKMEGIHIMPKDLLRKEDM